MKYCIIKQEQMSTVGEVFVHLIRYTNDCDCSIRRRFVKSHDKYDSL